MVDDHAPLHPRGFGDGFKANEVSDYEWNPASYSH